MRGKGLSRRTMGSQISKSRSSGKKRSSGGGFSRSFSVSNRGSSGKGTVTAPRSTNTGIPSAPRSEGVVNRAPVGKGKPLPSKSLARPAVKNTTKVLQRPATKTAPAGKGTISAPKVLQAPAVKNTSKVLQAPARRVITAPKIMAPAARAQAIARAAMQLAQQPTNPGPKVRPPSTLPSQLGGRTPTPTTGGGRPVIPGTGGGGGGIPTPTPTPTPGPNVPPPVVAPPAPPVTAPGIPTSPVDTDVARGRGGTFGMDQRRRRNRGPMNQLSMTPELLQRLAAQRLSVR